MSSKSFSKIKLFTVILKLIICRINKCSTENKHLRLKVIGLIQARFFSSRLPGKALLKIHNKPILLHIYERLRYCSFLNQIVIATGDFEKNKAICEFAIKNNIPYYSGNESDLIDRIYKTAKKFEADAVVRITGDCPLVDPKLVNKLVDEFIKNSKIDLVTNCQEKTFPHGLDVEVYSKKMLQRLWEDIKDEKFREWFPLYVYNNRNKFKILNIKNTKNLSRLRWTVDYMEDFEFVTKIFDELYDNKTIFYMENILDLITRKPQITKINEKHIGTHNYDAPIGLEK